MLLDIILQDIEENNIKQKDICKALNLSQSYTSELLSGKKEMSLNQFIELCNFLNIEIKLIDKNR